MRRRAAVCCGLGRVNWRRWKDVVRQRASCWMRVGHASLVCLAPNASAPTHSTQTPWHTNGRKLSRHTSATTSFLLTLRGRWYNAASTSCACAGRWLGLWCVCACGGSMCAGSHPQVLTPVLALHSPGMKTTQAQNEKTAANLARKAGVRTYHVTCVQRTSGLGPLVQNPGPEHSPCLSPKPEPWKCAGNTQAVAIAGEETAQAVSRFAHRGAFQNTRLGDCSRRHIHPRTSVLLELRVCLRAVCLAPVVTTVCHVFHSSFRCSDGGRGNCVWWCCRAATTVRSCSTPSLSCPHMCTRWTSVVAPPQCAAPWTFMQRSWTGWRVHPSPSWCRHPPARHPNPNPPPPPAVAVNARCARRVSPRRVSPRGVASWCGRGVGVVWLSSCAVVVCRRVV